MAETEEKQEPTTKTVENEPRAPLPTLADDYGMLKTMNILREVMVRMQLGHHPNKAIEGILSRRMDFEEQKFQGPRPVRIIITILALFLLCSLVYIGIWLFASSIGFHALKETSSLILYLFFLSGCGFAIFNNLSVPDETRLKDAIKERLLEIEVELNIQSGDEA